MSRHEQGGGHNWTSDLKALGWRLREDGRRMAEARGKVGPADTMVPSAWSWYKLPRGAVVAVRVNAGYLEVRVARRAASPSMPAQRARAAWDREVAIFVRELGLQGWASVDVKAPEREAVYRCPTPVLP